MNLWLGVSFPTLVSRVDALLVKVTVVLQCFQASGTAAAILLHSFFSACILTLPNDGVLLGFGLTLVNIGLMHFHNSQKRGQQQLHVPRGYDLPCLQAKASKCFIKS